MKKSTKYLTKLSMLTDVAVILMFLEIPILPAFPYLKLDFSDVPALIGGFAMGPVAAIIIELLKNAIHLIIKNDGTGGIGNLANFIIGCALTVPAAWYYLGHKNRKGVFVGLLIGVVSAIVAGVVFNLFVLLPLYGIVETQAKMAVIYGGIIPINAIKSVCASIVTMIFYKSLSPLLHK